VKGNRIATTMLAAVLVLTAAACQGDSPEPPPVTTTPVASPTPTPTPTTAALPDFTEWQTEPADIPVPPMPAAAKERTKAGSVAFGKYYIALINHALLTGENRELAALAAPECDICETNAAGFVSTFTKEQSYLGDPRYTITGSRQEDLSSTGAGASVFVTSKPFKIREKSEVTSVKAQHLALVFRLSWTGNAWKVTDYTVGDI